MTFKRDFIRKILQRNLYLLRADRVNFNENFNICHHQMALQASREKSFTGDKGVITATPIFVIYLPCVSQSTPPILINMHCFCIYSRYFACEAYVSFCFLFFFFQNRCKKNFIIRHIFSSLYLNFLHFSSTWKELALC